MIFSRALRRLAPSTELGGLAGDSFYSGIWLGAVSIADLVQIALVTHILGLAQYGRLALAMSVVILVGQFFDVRVGTAETTFGAARITSEDWSGAAAVFRFGYAIDAITGILGFLVVASAAPFVGPFLVGDGGTQLILLFGLTLLVSTVDESSATALRLMGRFRLLAFYMSGLEGVRVAAVSVALAVDRSLTAVLVALVAYDLVGAAVNWAVANRVFSRTSGRSLVGRTSEPFAERGEMLRMIFHTNVVTYARIAQVQLPTLLLGALTSTSQVGLYKVGTAAGSIVGRLAAPAYTAVLPRLSRLWAAQKRDEMAHLIRQATPIATAVVGGALLVLVLFRSPVLRLIGSDEAVDAVPVLILTGVGYTISGIMFWYPGLIYAMGRSGVVSAIALSTAVLQIALLVPLAAVWGSSGAAVALCVSMVATNLLGGVVGFRGLRAASSEAFPLNRLPTTKQTHGRLP